MQAPAFTPSSGNVSQRWSSGRIIGATLIALLVAVGFYFLYRFSNVIFVLFIAAVLATALRPAVLWLERRGVPQWLGILLLYLLIALATLAIVAAMAPLMIAQGTSLYESLPAYYTQARETIASVNNPLVRTFVNQLPQQLPLSSPASSPTTDPAAAATQAVSLVRSLGWSLFGLIAVALIAYFWILDREQIVRATLLMAPAVRRDGARELWEAIEAKVGAFIRGQALLCLSIGVLSGIAFFAIGVPNALLISVLAGVFEAIPYVGPILTAALAIVVTLAQSPEKIWWVVGACLVIQQLENALLVPRIMDQAVGVNAVVTLLAIAAFGTLLGVGGAIMAIPLAVILQLFFERVVEGVQQGTPTEITGRDQVAVLRYLAQDLGHDIRGRIREQQADAHEEQPEEQLEAVVGDIDQLLQTLNASGPAGAESTFGARSI